MTQPVHTFDAAMQRIRQLEDELKLANRLIPKWQSMDTAPVDRRILLLHPTANGMMAVDIGRWDDQAYHRAPKPYWRYEGRVTASVHFCRTFPPTGWMALPQ